MTITINPKTDRVLQRTATSIKNAAIAVGGLAVSEPKSASFSFSADDDKTVIPCDTALTATLDGSVELDENFAVELRAVAAITVTVNLANGATMMHNGASVTTLSVADEGSSILICGTAIPGKFYAYKIGA